MNGSSAPVAPNPTSPNKPAPTSWPQPLLAVPTSVAYTKFVHAAFVAQGLLDLDTKVNPYGIKVDWENPRRGFPITLFLSLPRVEQIRGVDRLKFLTAAAICIVEPEKVLRRLQQHLSAELLARLINDSPTNLRKEEKHQIIQCMPAVLMDSFIVAVAIPSLLLDLGESRPALAYQILVDLFLVPLLGIHYRLGVNRLEVSSSKVDIAGTAATDSINGDVIKLIKKVLVPRGQRRHNIQTDLKVLGKHEPNYAILALARFFTWALHRLHNDDNPAWIDEIKSAFP